MYEQSQDNYLLANLTIFAEHVCQTISDMTDTKFSLRRHTLGRRQFSSPFKFVVYSHFYGRLTGSYVISASEHVIQSLTKNPLTEVFEEGRERISGLMKEVLNISVSMAIIELENQFGQLTHMSPTLIIGEVEFPDVLCASIEIECPGGLMLCAFTLNMAQLKIGVKLEEAQRKLNRIHETHNEMMVQPLLLPGARFSVVYKSLNEAGGDIYDVIRISDEQFGYFIGDVSGHDIGTSFITASIKALLRQNCSSLQTPLQSMQIINSVLFDLLGDCKYITAAYILLDRTEQTVTFINMGHPPLLFIPLKGPPCLVEAHGDVLGAFKDAIFEMQIISVSPGDRLIIYTDGLIENQKSGIWSKGLNGLLELCTNLHSVALPDLANTLYSKCYSGSERPQDDVVVIGIEV